MLQQTVMYMQKNDLPWFTFSATKHQVEIIFVFQKINTETKQISENKRDKAKPKV